MSVTEHQFGATCPSCGRFVGPLEKCPYCGANITKRLPLRAIRLACLVLAVLGVGALVFAVSGAATPTTHISAIGATMNYAYVRLYGRVTQGPVYDADAGSLRFNIADDTGEIQAWAFGDVARELLAANKVPAMGDRIDVQGTLRVRDDFTSLNVASAAKLELVPPTPTAILIQDIGADDEMKFVMVQGDVREIEQPYDGLTLVTIGDEGGEIDVAVNGDLNELYGALTPIERGDSVQVQGIVAYYRDTPQLLLRHPRDLTRLDVPNTAGALAQVDALDAARVGQWVKVSGTVTSVTPFAQGLRVMLDDGTGELLVLLWQDVFDQLANAADLQNGARLVLAGRLAEYRGKLEIIPARGEDIQIGAPTAGGVAADPAASASQAQPTQIAHSSAEPSRTPRATRAPTSVPILRTISGLTSEDKESTVIVRGTITKASPFSQGMRYTVEDNTADIILLIWSDVLNAFDNHALLVPGAKVRVQGKLDEFNGALEIIPRDAADIKITKVSALPTPSVRSVQSVTTDDLDKSVRLEGTVTAITEFSQGKYFVLRDDTGEIQIAVFRNVLEPIQGRFVAGAQVMVDGKVNLFRGKLEVVADSVTFR